MLKRKEVVSASNFLYTSPRNSDEMLMTADTHNAAIALEQKVKENGGVLKFNSVSRTWTKQQQLRKAYDDYQKLSEEDKKKTTFVPLAAFPGHSFHESYRAIDVSLSNLKFPSLPYDQWLQKFWEISAPLGFTPINNTPDMSLSEAWHFDFKNEWDPVSKALGYGTAAQCAILDVGNWDPSESSDKVRNMFIQAQLLRLGKYEIGTIDGVLGSKSVQAIQNLGLGVADLDNTAQLLLQM